MADSVSPGDAAALLESVLGPLLDDFDQSFRRGLKLLEACPDAVMAVEARHEMQRRLQEAQAQLQAAPPRKAGLDAIRGNISVYYGRTDRAWTTTRAAVSVALPGVKGTTTRRALLGQD